MTKLPSLSSKAIIRALLKGGFSYAPMRGKGSHTALFKEDAHGKHLVIVPKRKDMPAGTLGAILDQANLTKEEFLTLL